jgi:hypothetical protein
VIAFFVAIKLANAPLAKLAEWEAQLEAQNVTGETTFTLIDDEVYDSIQRNIAFRKALLLPTKKDSMVLVVNLPDSSLNLFLNGVFIHNVRIDAYEIDPLLRDLSLDLYFSQFSKPLLIDTTLATIVKEPIIEKEAPKNPDELIASLSEPDSLIFKPAYVKLTAENGINFFIEQTEDNLKEDKAARETFKSAFKSARRKAFFNALFNSEAYDYQPNITLKVTKIELTAIYRALPKETKVVVYYR